MTQQADGAVGERIRRLRIDAGYSQRQLAQAVGVGFPHISKIESGKEPASEGLLRRIAAELGADEDGLLLLADHVPDELVEVVREKPDLAPMFLRQWRTGAITDAEVEQLLRDKGR